MSRSRCQWPGGITFRPDGKNELDPCLYEEAETYRNVTVHVLRCAVCGHIEIEWERQENTEELEPKGEKR